MVESVSRIQLLQGRCSSGNERSIARSDELLRSAWAEPFRPLIADPNAAAADPFGFREYLHSHQNSGHDTGAIQRPYQRRRWRHGIGNDGAARIGLITRLGGER